jgi:TPR repeat protein
MALGYHSCQPNLTCPVMSFTLTAWPQPTDQPLPTTVMQAQAQLDAVWAAEGAAPEPRFLALARALDARFPDSDDGDSDMYDHGLDILERSPDKDRAYNINLYPRDDSFELGFNHLIVQANDLGLHVMDGQNGVVYLAHGEVLTLGPNSAAAFTCRLDDAVVRKDWGAAWLECRRLAPQRLPEALTVWALMVVQGRKAPPHPALGAALAQLGGTAPERDKRVRWCLDKVPAAHRSLQAQLLDGLRNAADLAAFVDVELQRAPSTQGSGGGGAALATAPDAATAEAARTLGIDPDLIARAEAGSPQAQCKLALKFIEAPGKSTPALAKLAVMWLERSAAQNFSMAQALLGDGLLRGWRSFPVDMERGLALLEAAAAADDVDGLNYLAQYLYDKSIRRRPGQDSERLKDPTSQRNLARVPQLLMRAAAQGSPRALFWLAARLWDEVGTPRDDVAAKAVMQLARTRAAKYCVEQPETLALMATTAADSKEVMALAQELGRDLKQLPAVINARHAAQTRAVAPPMAVATAPASTKPAPPRRRAPVPDDDEDSQSWQDTPTARPALHAGHLALGLGMVGFVLWFLFITSLGRGSFKPIALVVGLVSAFGVWRCTADLDWGALKRTVLSALALLPGAGFLVGAAVLLQMVRGRT